MVQLKKIEEEPGKCSPAEIAKEMGMPLGAVLNVIEEMMV